jgi:hypothetical protein
LVRNEIKWNLLPNIQIGKEKTYNGRRGYFLS